jgi:hypothetical protein
MRYFFTISAAIVSLLCFIAVPGLWLRSESRHDKLRYLCFRPCGIDGDGLYSDLISCRGRVAFCFHWTRRIDPPLPADGPGLRRELRWHTGTLYSGDDLAIPFAAPVGTAPGRSGFLWDVNETTVYSPVAIKEDRPNPKWITPDDYLYGHTWHRRVKLVVPMWAPLALAAFAFLLSSRPYFRCRRWKRLGLCSQCGYNLRATPDRCPECGAVPKDRAK